MLEKAHRTTLPETGGIALKIQLKKEFRGSFEVLDVREGTTIEDLYRSIETQLPYRILAARVNNKFEALSYRIKKECKIELLDIQIGRAHV